MNGRLVSGKRKAYYAQDKGSYNISSYDALSAKNPSAKQRSTTMLKPGAQIGSKQQSRANLEELQQKLAAVLGLLKDFYQR